MADPMDIDAPIELEREFTDALGVLCAQLLRRNADDFNVGRAVKMMFEYVDENHPPWWCATVILASYDDPDRGELTKEDIARRIALL